MINYNWSKSDKDIKDWNLFLIENDKGHYLQSSYWLESYNAYGFKSDLLLAKNTEDKIVGGLGIVYGGLFPFKICVTPCGPIILNDYKEISEHLISEFLNRAKRMKAFYCHICVPLLKSDHKILNNYCLSELKPNSIFLTGNRGVKIKQISTINGFRFVNLSTDDHPHYDSVFKNYNTNTKRNVKKSKQQGLTLKFVSTENDIKNAYKLIENNGRTQGYAVRAWEDMHLMLLNMVNEGMCIIPVAIHNNIIKGALIIFEIGQRLTYISGGTLREDSSLKIGHFLHDSMIKYALEKDYKFYDISVGGSEGVIRFKEGFGGIHIPFVEPRYWILNTTLFNIYNKTSTLVNHNKILFSRLFKLKRKLFS